MSGSLPYSPALEAEALAWLTYEHDGPVSPFVLLSRACDAAASRRFPPEELANALWTALGEPE